MTSPRPRCSTPAGRAHVAGPVGALPEHRHQVPLTLVAGNHDGNMTVLPVRRPAATSITSRAGSSQAAGDSRRGHKRRDWSIGLIRPTSFPPGSARTRRRKPGRRLLSGGAQNIHSGSPPAAPLPGHQSMQIGGYGASRGRGPLSRRRQSTAGRRAVDVQIAGRVRPAGVMKHDLQRGGRHHLATTIAGGCPSTPATPTTPSSTPGPGRHPERTAVNRPPTVGD